MTNHKARKKLANQKWVQRCMYPCRGYQNKLLGAVAQTDYTGNFVTHPGATQAKFTLHGDMLLSGGRGSLVKVIRLIFTGVSHVLRYFFVVQRKAFLHVTGQFLSELYYMRKSQDVLKVLQRRNFYVMFITKNHLYQLINEDCHLKLIEMKIFYSQTGKNWP